MADYPWPSGLPAPYDCQFVDDPRRARHRGVLPGVDRFIDLGGDTLNMVVRVRMSAEQRRLYTGFISKFRGADRLELRDYQHPGNSHPEAFSGGRILRARGATGSRRPDPSSRTAGRPPARSCAPATSSASTTGSISSPTR